MAKLTFEAISINSPRPIPTRPVVGLARSFKIKRICASSSSPTSDILASSSSPTFDILCGRGICAAAAQGVCTDDVSLEEMLFLKISEKLCFWFSSLLFPCFFVSFLCYFFVLFPFYFFISLFHCYFVIFCMFLCFFVSLF